MFHYSNYDISAWMLPVGILGAILLIVIIVKSIEAMKRKKTGGLDSLVGSIGVAYTDINPEGKVKIHGEIWNAVSKEDISKDSLVKVLETKSRMRILVEEHKEEL